MAEPEEQQQAVPDPARDGQDRPRGARQRRPPRPRPRRRGGRGVPGGGARRPPARAARPGASRGASRAASRPRGAGHRRGPRLRQPVRPAHRPPRPRAERLLRAAALRHAAAPRSSGGGRAAIILSAARSPSTTRALRSPTRRSGPAGLPVLGICYGAQLMARELGGDVLPAAQREYGPATVRITDDDGLFAGLDRDQPVWMSHGDSITRLPEPASGRPRRRPRTPFAGLADPARRLYGIQFHPEVVHTPRGRDVLRNFVVGIAGARPTWTPANFIESTVDEIRSRVDAHARETGGDGKVICALSGGVDFGRRGDAGPPGGRRPPDLHLRRPRAHAQEGVGAPAGHLRAEPGHAPGHGRRPRAVPRPPRRRRPTPSRSGGSSATSSSGSSRRRRRSSGGSTS